MPIAEPNVPALPVALGRCLDCRITSRLALQILLDEPCVKALFKSQTSCHWCATYEQGRVAESDHIAWPQDFTLPGGDPAARVSSITTQPRPCGLMSAGNVVTIASTTGPSEEHTVAVQLEHPPHAIVPRASVNASRLPKVRWEPVRVGENVIKRRKGCSRKRLKFKNEGVTPRIKTLLLGVHRET